MKKKIFLVGIIAAMGLGAFLLSCSDDKDEFKGCFCSITFDNGNQDRFELSVAELKIDGLRDCADAQRYIMSGYGIRSATCIDL